MNKLSEDEVRIRLSNLKDWDKVDEKLYVEYNFKDFKSAFEFMTKFTKTINSLDHHPDWSNSYNRVFISLVTHSAGGITELDFKLAKAAADIYKDYLF